MIGVLDIIHESIPDLLALDLSENKLSQTSHLKIMIDKCPNLKILHIGSNKVIQFLYFVTYYISLIYYYLVLPSIMKSV